MSILFIQSAVRETEAVFPGCLISCTSSICLMPPPPICTVCSVQWQSAVSRVMRMKGEASNAEGGSQLGTAGVDIVKNSVDAAFDVWCELLTHSLLLTAASAALLPGPWALFGCSQPGGSTRGECGENPPVWISRTKNKGTLTSGRWSRTSMSLLVHVGLPTLLAGPWAIRFT